MQGKKIKMLKLVEQEQHQFELIKQEQHLELIEQINNINIFGNIELKVADVLHRAKSLVNHFGIYIGDGLVLHNTPNMGCNIISLCDYADGKIVYVKRTIKQNEYLNIKLFNNRIKELLTKKEKYKLLSNNCESVVNYLISGVKESKQIKSVAVGLALFGFLAAILGADRNTIVLSSAIGGISGLLINDINAKKEINGIIVIKEIPIPLLTHQNQFTRIGTEHTIAF